MRNTASGTITIETRRPVECSAVRRDMIADLMIAVWRAEWKKVEGCEAKLDELEG